MSDMYLIIFLVIDLFDGQQYSEDLKTGYSKVKKLTGRTFF